MHCRCGSGKGYPRIMQAMLVAVADAPRAFPHTMARVLSQSGPFEEYFLKQRFAVRGYSSTFHWVRVRVAPWQLPGIRREQNSASAGGPSPPPAPPPPPPTTPPKSFLRAGPRPPRRTPETPSESSSAAVAVRRGEAKWSICVVVASAFLQKYRAPRELLGVDW